jgi:DNA-binding MarR family transcriptional regulator
MSIAMKRAVRLDAYVLETLMRDLTGHDRRPSAFLVYLCLWHNAPRGRRRRVTRSLQWLAEETGLSKRAAQRAIAHLLRRGLLRVERRHATAVPEYELLRPWRRAR